MPHLMIDLETLSTRPDAVICQIGWAFFKPEGAGPGSSGMICVDPQSCIDLGMKVDWSTVRWWLGQSDDARNALTTNMLDVRLYSALVMFERQLHTNLEGVWSHGASFDIPIMETAFRVAGLSIPWTHKIVRDTRTIFWLARPDWPDNPNKHCAEDDAIAQVYAVQSSYRKLHRPPAPESAGQPKDNEQ